MAYMLYTNNGIDINFLNSLVYGSTFIIQKKKNKYDGLIWLEPQEIVVVSVIHQPQTTEWADDYYTIKTLSGLDIEITVAMIVPDCENYEIYKNWQIFFDVHIELNNRNKIQLHNLENHISSFEEFQKCFYDNHSEKLI